MKRFLFLLIFLVACKSEVVHDLPELEANKVVVLLKKHGIAAERELNQADNTWAISVDSEEEARAIEILINSRVFQHLALDKKPASDANVGGGIFASSHLQRYQLEELKARGIEKTLLRIPEVLDARVNFNLPKSEDEFEVKFEPQSASALLIVSPDFSIAKEDIAHLIAKSVGLKADQVAVLLSVEEISREIMVSSAEISDSALSDSSMSAANETWWHTLTSPLVTGGLLGLIGLLGIGVFAMSKRSKDITILEP